MNQTVTITFNLGAVLTWIIVGLIAGFLAGVIVRGRRFGLVSSIILGLVGALIGGFIFSLLHIDWGNDFGSPHETALTQQFDKPVFVYNYPSAVKAFYMQPVEGRPEVCRSVDLLAPEGYGEITGGSERIYDSELLEKRVAQIGISRENYAWYLGLRRYGSVPHSGFGLGVERTVAWICGLPHIRETIPYPRMLKRLYP